MSQISAANRVFNFGEKNNPNNIIFGDLLQYDQALSTVCKAFHKQNQNALIRLGDKIALQGRVTAADSEAYEERLPQLASAIFSKMLQLQHFNSRRVGAFWMHVSKMREELAELAPEKRSESIFRIVNCLEDVNLAYAIVLSGPNDFAEGATQMFRMEHSFTNLVIGDRLAKRFTESATAEGLNPHDPSQIASCFAALYVSQNAAFKRVNRAVNFLEKPRSLTEKEFRSLEESIFSREREHQALPLLSLWGSVRPQINNGPAFQSFPFFIRNWMNDAGNAATLATVNRVTNGVGNMPPEIGKLTGLTRLSWYGYRPSDPLDTLPEEFGNLQLLEELSLEESDFTEIPDFVTRLPALQRLSLAGNRGPIRLFPDALDRKINVGSNYLTILRNNEFYQAYRFGQLVGFDMYDFLPRSTVLNSAYANLNQHELTDIPFRSWFRESCSIPNVPIALLAALMANMHGIAFLVLVAIFSIPLILLSLPITLLNFILNLAIEPLVTAMRDLFGLSRMVHVTDRLPAAPESAGDE